MRSLRRWQFRRWRVEKKMISGDGKFTRRGVGEMGCTLDGEYARWGVHDMWVSGVGGFRR